MQRWWLSFCHKEGYNIGVAIGEGETIEEVKAGIDKHGLNHGEVLIALLNLGNPTIPYAARLWLESVKTFKLMSVKELPSIIVPKKLSEARKEGLQLPNDAVKICLDCNEDHNDSRRDKKD